MISLSSATRVFVAAGFTDMRKSFNGLYGIVAQQLKQDPTSGHVFVFCNRSRNRIKLLLWDGSGLWVCTKRLEQGRFHWQWDDTSDPLDPHHEAAPGDQPNRDAFVITHESLSLLLGGIDLKETRPRSWYRITPGSD
jgi:transposase